MWNGQPGLTHALLLEQHNIEVQRARSPSGGANTSGVRFDLLQRSEQILRRKLGFDGYHLIEKGSLRDGTNGGGLFGFCLTYKSGFSERRDRASGLRQKYFTLAEIGA